MADLVGRLAEPTALMADLQAAACLTQTWPTPRVAQCDLAIRSAYGLDRYAKSAVHPTVEQQLSSPWLPAVHIQ